MNAGVINGSMRECLRQIGEATIKRPTTVAAVSFNNGKVGFGPVLRSTFAGSCRLPSAPGEQMALQTEEEPMKIERRFSRLNHERHNRSSGLHKKADGKTHMNKPRVNLHL